MAENEKQEGLQMEELEALAGEFTLDDLAEFDENLEFDVSDLESIKPVYTTKEKMKLIFMNNTVFSIIKWCFAGLGLIALVLYILAMVSSDLSEQLTTSLSGGVRGALTAVSNLIPISLMEVLAVVTVVGILAYAGFLIYKTIKEKEGIKIVGFWVQFGYVLVAVFCFGFLLYTLCYGVTTNRPLIYQKYLQEYHPNLFTEQMLDGAMLYYVDQINEVASDASSRDNIRYYDDGHSSYAQQGRSTAEIAEAVNACFDAAAEDYPFLKGSQVKAKTMLVPQLYTMMGVGSMYSPLTSEVLVNPDYPEVIVPMQVARAIAKQRGITDDGDASLVAFLVLSRYANELADPNGQYNMDYIRYTAYFDAYLELGTLVYHLSPDLHLYCAAPLKDTIKKDVVTYIKGLDTLYNNVSELEYKSTSSKTETNKYMILANLAYTNFNIMVDENRISLGYNTSDNPVPVKSRRYRYSRYLVAIFAEAQNGDWGADCADIWAEYNVEPEVNDGSNPSLYENNNTETDGEAA